MVTGKVTHPATVRRSIHKLPRFEIGQVRPDQSEQPTKVSFGAGRIPVRLDLRRLGFDQPANLELAFFLARQLAIAVGDAKKAKKVLE